MADYDYYEDYTDIENIEAPAAARSRRDADNSVAAGEFITYEICVRLVAEISATVLAPPPLPSVLPHVCFGFFTLCFFVQSQRPQKPLRNGHR